MHIRGFVWDASTGAKKSGVTVELKKRLPSNATVLTDTTGSDGMYEFQVNGNPYGVVDVFVDDSGSYRYSFGDVSLMRDGYWFDGELSALWQTLSDGYVDGWGDDVAITATSGMAGQVETGLIKILEATLEIYTPIAFTVTANSSGSPRSDGIFARLTRTGDDAGKTEIVYIAGDTTPTQDADTWEILLHTIVVPDGASSINSGMFTRNVAKCTFPLVGVDASDIDPNVSNTEYGYLDGVTSSIQTQLDGKAASSHTHNATDIGDGTISNTELSHLNNISGNIETRLNALEGRRFNIVAQLGSSVGDVIPTGYYPMGQLPVAATIVGCRAHTWQLTNLTFELFNEAPANWDSSGTPTDDDAGDAIVATGTIPTWTNQVTMDFSITNWDTALAADEIITLQITTNSAATWLMVVLECEVA